MTAASDIRAYLAVKGITADVNNVPQDVTDAVAVMDTGGYTPTHPHHSGTGTATGIIDRDTFQILLRNKSKASAETAMANIIAALDGITNATLNGQYYLSVFMTTPPTYLGKAQTGAGETNIYSLNFSTIRQRSAGTS